MIVSHNQLRIDKNVAGEDERGDDTVCELDAGGAWEEHGHKAEEDEDPEGAEEVGHPCTIRVSSERVYEWGVMDLQLVKSYFVWHANNVRAKKMPSVKMRACSTILLS